MLTEENTAASTTETGPAFDRLFLESTISHDEGAPVMAADLWVQGGGHVRGLPAAQYIDSDQSIEISRMRAMLPRWGSRRRAESSQVSRRDPLAC